MSTTSRPRRRSTGPVRHEPAKQRPGYANFEIADPPLKLVLFENPGAASPLNHLGVEVPSPADVVAAAERFGHAGLRHTMTEADRCCHAVQDKVWVDAPTCRWGPGSSTPSSPTTPAATWRSIRGHLLHRRVDPGDTVLRAPDRRREMSSAAVVVEDVHVAYGPTWALGGIDVEADAGTTLGVLGHNGAGKTTLVRVLTTLVRPTRAVRWSTAATSSPTHLRCGAASG